MSLYKQWDVTHYIFDVIVLTSSEKLFHHRIFHRNIDELKAYCLWKSLHYYLNKHVWKNKT